MLSDCCAIAPLCLSLGVIALLFTVDEVGWPDPGAMCWIATCCARLVDIKSRPAVFTSVAFPALRCRWSYAEPGEAAVHDRVRPCLSEGGMGERMMVMKQAEAVRIAAEWQRTSWQGVQ
jgi:hypothetical protein